MKKRFGGGKFGTNAEVGAIVFLEETQKLEKLSVLN